MTVIVEPPSAQINRKSRKNVEMVVAYRNIRKKVDCVEAQRIMYILNQLQRRLLLLGGFNSLTVEQFKQFPASCHKLRELVSSEDVDEIGTGSQSGPLNGPRTEYGTLLELEILKLNQLLRTVNRISEYDTRCIERSFWESVILSIIKKKDWTESSKTNWFDKATYRWHDR